MNTTDPKTSGAAAGAGAGSDPKPKTTEFDIPDVVKETHPKLVELILKTESMDADEKQYWFHILPIMKEDQIKQLNTILTSEQAKLSEIEKKYADQGTAPQKAPASNFSEEQFQKDKADLEKAESTAEEEEKAAESKLLEDIENF